MPHNNVAQALVSVVSIWSELEKIEERFGVKTQREPDFGFAFTSYKWAQGNSLQSVLKGSDLGVGDFVRSIKQIIDLLTQIAGASPALRKTCREGIARLDRGVISYMLEDL
jgi:ATP-dependent RNA helicase HelY